MTERLKNLGKASIVFLPAFFLLLTAFREGHASDKVFTIGIINSAPVLSRTIDGFKAGMAELGYVEGRDVRYIYNGIIKNDEDIIDAELRNLLSKDIDLFLTVGNDTSLRAKKAVEGTDIPVLVASFHRPAETGLVKSLVMPGGNVTGVAGLDRTEKALEWLKVLTPGLKKVFLPYNPDDSVSVISLPGLDRAASQLDIEILYQKVHSVEEAIAAIKKLPKDVKALFIIPSPTLNPRNSEINQAAIGRGIATGSHIALEGGIMVTLATDFFLIGKQTSRLAHQIRRGVKPADIPFETSDVFLTINLKTAKRIGIHIPDDIIAQANTIIR